MRDKQSVWKKIAIALLLIYIVSLAAVVLFWRPKEQLWESGLCILWPFASLRAAARTFQMSGWLEIFGTIAFFIPLGALLPLGIRLFRRGVLSYLALLFVAVVLNLGRFLTGEGSFVLDAVAGNLLGGMIGYGWYRIGAWIAAVRHRKRVLQETRRSNSYKESQRLEKNRARLDRDARGLPVVFYQIPLVAAVLFFAVPFVQYNRQELGNLNCSYATLAGLADTKITVRHKFPDEERVEGVYRTRIYLENEAVERARELFEGIGRSLGQTQRIDEEHIRFRDELDEAELWLNLTGGTYTLTDYSRRKQDNDEPVRGKEEAKEPEVRSALAQWKITIPSGSTFEEIGNGTYSFTYHCSANGEKLYDGRLLCDYNVRGEITRVDYQMPECLFYKQYDVISEQEAYRELIAGRFYAIGYESGRGIYSFEINGMDIGYSVDSKGFYQPIYRVDAIINGQETEIDLPAIKG